MELLFALCLLWGGFICGIIYRRGFAGGAGNCPETTYELQKSKTTFRSPLVRFE
ncbi:MAG: hypothetical protein FWE47_00515 [Oscillospiraceae bacterium]|nr:hypothetical protein [Oscillospiraceae bacterium]